MWLSRHQLLWTQHGLVAGAGWLQAHLTLPLRGFATLLLVLMGLALLLPCQRRLRQFLALAIGDARPAGDGGTHTADPLARGAVPGSLLLQERYLKNAIEATQWGFQLDQIKSQVDDPSRFSVRLIVRKVPARLKMSASGTAVPCWKQTVSCNS